ncbi:MAG: REP element-mobilizing transposase RayT [Candidatus Methanohalarchaeum thermophilum]|uniref:REP element-mobilizing transposase RayT n=1 Tax=Methanohalarchaeum thermophilum TaxID=1903181 RepID=A0A1Q6DSB0_METT1|nr:MAG: REP element-mobilizing transposase RayT [Candidatus Methanohalarchaeum thermophilum]
MPRGYSRERTSVHLLNYHFIWCPKYRKKVLKGEVKKRLRELIQEKANELGLKILKLSISPDHVHLFIEGKPTISPNKII